MDQETADQVEQVKEQVRERARTEAKRTADNARVELGKLLLDATEEYFPEQVQARRRQDMAQGFVAGLVVGLLVGIVFQYAFEEE